MKSIQELGTVTSSDISALIPTIIKKEIETLIEEKTFIKDLFREDTSLVGKPGKEIHIPKITGDIEYATVSEGQKISAAVSAQEVTVSEETITPTKIGTLIRITRETILYGMVNMLDYMVEYVTTKLAEALDYELYKTLVGATKVEEAFSITGSDTINLAHDKVLKVESVTISGSSTSGYQVDYYDGIVKLAASGDYSGTVTYWYTTFENVLDASTTGKLTYGDIVDAKYKVIIGKFNPNKLIISPLLESYIIKDERFIDKEKYGGDVMAKGTIGRIAGLDVIVSRNVWDVAVVVDAPKQGWLVWKEKLLVEDDYDKDSQTWVVYFTEIFGADVIWEDAVAIVTNTQSDAADL